jgi:hypothetical protein
MRRNGSAVRWLSALSCFLAGVIEAYAGAAAADPQASQSNSQPPVQEVTVTAHKLIDERTLDRVIIPQFVKSHGAQNRRSHQIGRWTSPASICPSAEGIQAPAADYLARRILAVAASVGAPTAVYGHCRTNVEVIFTPGPQEQVTYFGKNYRALLGNEAQSQKELLTFSHEIRAWYTTVTHTWGSGWTLDNDEPWVNVEPPFEGSTFSSGLLSGFANVLIIVDSRKISGHALKSIADYIAMLALTRTSLDGCSELPSIIDLLSADCAGRAPPDSLTKADVAFLKALYSSNLVMNFNLELGEIRDRIRNTIGGPSDLQEVQ